MKRISIRLDVDTHLCISEGVPNLLALADKYNCKFTFFVNIGVSVNRILFLSDMLKKNSKNTYGDSLSAREKLGIKKYIEVAVKNPPISKWRQELESIYSNGHEIGLHGGRNHATWAKQARFWNHEKICEEINFGISQLKKIVPEIQLIGFASPGWTSSSEIVKVVKDFGFKYIADNHGRQNSTKIRLEEGLFALNTNLTGEPGGIGYFENLIAKNANWTELDFRIQAKNDLNLDSSWLVLYDHPYLLGRNALSRFESYLKTVTDSGAEIRTMKEMILDD